MRLRAALLAVTAVLASVGPAVANPGDTVDELTSARNELGRAAADLDDIDRRLASARSDLDGIEGRLDAAHAELAVVREELAVAEEQRRDAAATAADALAVLEDATAELSVEQAALDEQEDQLADRVRSMWMYGGSDPGTLLMEGLVRSTTLHDATITIKTAQDIVEDDTELVAAAVDRTRAENDSRSQVAAAQKTARQAETRAAEHARAVAALVSEQERLVAEIAAEQSRKTELIAAIETDRVALARLVDQLRDRVSALSAQLADALLAADPTAGFDGPVPAWASVLPGRGRQWAPAIAGAAAHAGVDARLFAALVWSESSFHPGAVSHAGAIGLSQLMPGTAAGLGVDPWDPVQNLVGGARYLRIQLERFGSADLALAAYNAGPGRVEQAGRAIPQIAETQIYVLRVLERYQQLVDAS